MPWRLLKLLVLLLLLLLPGTALFLVVSAIQTLPSVTDAGTMQHEDVGRIKNTLKQHDPRRLRDGEQRRLQITQRDLNLMLNSTFPYSDRLLWLVTLDEARADVSLSVALPANPVGDYLNISARLKQVGTSVAVEQLNFGNTSLPGWLCKPIVSAADMLLRSHIPEYGELLATIEQLQIHPQSVQVEYRWQAELAKRIQARGRDLFLSAADRERILAYYEEIARQSRSLAGAPVSLDRLLQPLFSLARQRSRTDGGARAENRALLLALGLAVQGSSIRHLTGDREGAGPKRPVPLRLTLQGRRDLAQHFTISAAIAAAGGSSLADTIGVFKEVDDSRGGSGFSFADLLADRAGVSLAEAAIGERAGAVQGYMSNGPRESGYMPGFDQLPEGLMELEFKSRFEDLDSASYALVNDEIERRIAGCEIHRDS